MNKINNLFIFIIICSIFACNNKMVEQGVQSTIDPRTPEINIRQGSNNIASGSVFSFGDIVESGFTITLDFSIENIGTTDLELTGDPIIELTGNDIDLFIIDEQPADTIIRAGRSTTFTITFNPISIGEKSALITIHNTDLDESIYTFTIGGSDLRVPEINIKQGESNITSGTGSYDFGGVEINSISSLVNFTIENLGTADLYLTGDPIISIAGDDADMFILTTQPSSPVIEPGRNLVFTLIFNPTTLDEKTAVVTIMNNDSDEGTYSFTLMGNTPPLANFKARLRTGIAPISVEFTNTTEGDATSWEWDFDYDGNPDSTIENPTFKFNYPGTYTVRLTATGPGGNNTIVRSAYISILSSLEHFIDIDYIEPGSVYCADIDGDGDSDVVAISRSSDLTNMTFSWWENVDATAAPGSGNGTIWTESAFTSGSITDAAEVLAIADIDGINGIDIIVGNEGGFAWWVNDGNGNFTENIIYNPGGVNLRGIQIFPADIDGANGIDIIMSNIIDGLVWYQNLNGNGYFGTIPPGDNPQDIYTTADSNPTSLFASDLNGDTEIDIIKEVYTSEHKLGYWTDLSSWTWVELEDNIYITCIHVDDFDGINGPDIIASSQATDEILIWKNSTTPGVFESGTGIAENISNPPYMGSADLNNDTYPDIYVADSDKNRILWLENYESGTNFIEHVAATDFLGVSSIDAADIDGDNNIELVATALDCNLIKWFDVSTDIWLKHSINNDSYQATSVYAADMNLDGDMDVVGLARDGIYLYDNYNGMGTSWNDQVIDTDLTSTGTLKKIFASNLNGDSYPDIIASNDSEISAWINNGNNTYTNITDINYSHYTFHVVDIDNDQDDDLITATTFPSPPELLFWENNGDGTFQAGVQIASDASTRFTAVCSAFINSDAYPDIIAGILLSDDSSIVRYWVNDGDGTFTGPETLDGGFTDNSIYSITAGDINGDGDIDIASAVYKSGISEISWWLNDGTSDFATLQIITDELENPHHIFSTNLDNDQYADIICASNSDNRISWIEYDGISDFTTTIIAENFYSAMSVHAEDLDSDGDMDIIGAAQQGDEVAWWENNIVNYGP